MFHFYKVIESFKVESRQFGMESHSRARQHLQKKKSIWRKNAKILLYRHEIQNPCLAVFFEFFTYSMFGRYYPLRLWDFLANYRAPNSIGSGTLQKWNTSFHYLKDGDSHLSIRFRRSEIRLNFSYYSSSHVSCYTFQRLL